MIVHFCLTFLQQILFFQDTCLSHFKEGREQVEALIIRGATKWEARYDSRLCLARTNTDSSLRVSFVYACFIFVRRSRGVIAESLRTGLAPFLNQMMIICLAFLPGMMSGTLIVELRFSCSRIFELCRARSFLFSDPI